MNEDIHENKYYKKIKIIFLFMAFLIFLGFGIIKSLEYIFLKRYTVSKVQITKEKGLTRIIDGNFNLTYLLPANWKRAPIDPDTQKKAGAMASPWILEFQSKDGSQRLRFAQKRQKGNKSIVYNLMDYIKIKMAIKVSAKNLINRIIPISNKERNLYNVDLFINFFSIIAFLGCIIILLLRIVIWHLVSYLFFLVFRSSYEMLENIEFFVIKYHCCPKDF